MKPFVIRQGDFLHRLAYGLGFDPDVVWNDPRNDELRKARPNPDHLLPGDILYVPDQSQPDAQPLVTGSTNAFTADVPTTTLICQFVGAHPTDYASKAYTVQELPELTGLVTDGNGVVTLPIQVTLRTATIVFTETGESFTLVIGGMDPLDTPTGLFKRLQNLGHIPRRLEFDTDGLESNLAVLR